MNNLPLGELPDKPSTEIVVDHRTDPYQHVYGNLLRYQSNLLSPRTFRDIEELISMGRELLLLPEIQGYWNQRVGALLAREWQVLPGRTRGREISEEDQKAADFVREQIESINFDQNIKDAYLAIWFGYSVSEIIWAKEGKEWLITEIVSRKQERFRFSDQGSLRLLTKENRTEGIPVDPSKFWVVKYGGIPGDPYGQGLAESAYWPALFLKGGVKSWLLWLEKGAAGSVIVKHSAQSSNEEKNKALKLAQALKAGAAAAIPESMQVIFQDSIGKGGLDYERIYRTADQMLQKLILGQITTVEGSSGFSDGAVQLSVRDAIIKNDSDILHQSFNQQIVERLVWYNFGDNVAVPKVWRVIDKAEDMLALANVELKLKELGYERSPEEINNIFGSGLVKTQPVDLNQPGILGPTFDEDVVETPQLIANRTAKQLAIADQGLEMIRKLAQESDTLEQLRDRLYGLILSMPYDQTARAIAESGILARIAGEFEVIEEINSGAN